MSRFGAYKIQETQQIMQTNTKPVAGIIHAAGSVSDEHENFYELTSSAA
jgi:hypothetical protein